MSKIKYMIADDHSIFRQGIKYSLAEDIGLECVGEAGDGEALLQLLETTQADVILLDLKMPGMDGMTAAPVIRSKYPDTKIIVLTMYDDEQYILHMLDSGANGYLVKNAEPAEIINAIHTAHSTGYYFSEMVSKTMLKNLVEKRQVQPRFDKTISLNEKEIQILKLICQEYTTTEIAGMVFLSARTVEGIRAGMLEKIGVRNTAGLVLFAAKSGYIN